MITRKMAWIISLFAAGFLSSALASPEQERVYLLQVLHQMDAMQSTLRAAQQAQSPADRVQFHYTAYPDAAGHTHHGVLEDLQLIRAGIEEKLSSNALQPRAIEPIEGDYLADSQRTTEQGNP
jgi:RAQPRD family integrative conjugative element protein